MEDLKPSDLKMTSTNLSSRSFEEANSDIVKLYDYVTLKANEAINWYYFKKKPKRIYGLILRYCSIVFIALAGILPILITIFDRFKINPAWSAVAVALAALMIAIDKFGGFTSGWIRYVIAAQKLGQALEEFRFTWESNKHGLSGTSMSSEEIKTVVNNCKEFLQKVQAIVSEETQKWMAEFQSALNDIEAAAKVADEAAKATVKAKEEGAIAVTVTNGSSCVQPWSISIDGIKVSDYSGNTVALSNFKPGIAIVKITGIINGKNVSQEIPVKITGGEISNISMTLS